MYKTYSHNFPLLVVLIVVFLSTAIDSGCVVLTYNPSEVSRPHFVCKLPNCLSIYNIRSADPPMARYVADPGPLEQLRNCGMRASTRWCRHQCAMDK